VSLRRAGVEFIQENGGGRTTSEIIATTAPESLLRPRRRRRPSRAGSDGPRWPPPGTPLSAILYAVLESKSLRARLGFRLSEGRFIPRPKIAEGSEDHGTEIANAFPLPRRRPTTLGFYYELVRAQGDGAEGEYVLTPRRCNPKVDMPEPCYQPERGRQDFPLRRE
jgi:hypothetical protein